MNMSTILKGIKMAAKYGGKELVKAAPWILCGIGTAGVAEALVLTAKKTPDAKVEFDKEKAKWEATQNKEDRNKADYIFKLIRIGAQHYWVVVSVATGAVLCFWLANGMTFKRLMKALTAAGLSTNLSTKAKEELENKIKELDGEKHLQKIKDEIDADKIKNDPPVQDQIIDTGLGMHLCYEPITGRYFYSNIERIKRAVINCRNYLQKDGYLSVNDWFCELNLDTTDLQLCWTAESIDEVNEFDIETSSQLTHEDVPVLVIRYSINPTMERRDW